MTPGAFATVTEAAKPPSDAIVLFDGKNLSQWRNGKGEPAAWKIEDGAMTPSNGSIHTAKFGDGQQPGARKQRGLSSGQIRGAGVG